MLINSCSGTISTPMREREVDQLTQTLAESFKKIRPMLPVPSGAASGV
jgi:ribulose 1,5-bisphosphate carboxylase large subunit-like protein